MFYPVTLQSVVVLLAAVLLAFWEGAAAAGAVLYGGVASLVNAALLGWRQRQGERQIHRDVSGLMRLFYRSSLERIIVVSICLGIGLGSMDLKPMPMLAGFVIGWFAWAIAAMGEFVTKK